MKMKMMMDSMIDNHPRIYVWLETNVQEVRRWRKAVKAMVVTIATFEKRSLGDEIR
jgi:hypothetical protein